MEELTLLNQIGFWLFALLMVGSALGVVFNKSIVYSALMLLMAFLSIAGVFVLLNAPFIAAAQILVYGVGLVIVLIFGIMLTGDKPFVDPVGQERPKRFWMLPAAVSLLLLGFLLWALLYPNYQLTAVNGLFVPKVDILATGGRLEGLQAILTDGGVAYIGKLLFSTYLLPFEIASILLLLAMIGAIIMAKREFPEEDDETQVNTGKYPLGSQVESIPPGEEGISSQEKESNSMLKEDKSLNEVEKETLGVH